MASRVDDGPDLETDGVSRWRLADIRDKVLAHFHVRLCLESIRCLLRSLGYSHVSPRPVSPLGGGRQAGGFAPRFP